MNLAGLNLLVLEDEYLIGLDLIALLEECGARSVRVLSTIEELIAWIDSREMCDVSILDVVARGRSSLSAASLLKQLGIPLVFTTAYDHERRGVEGFAGVPVILKPYGKHQILQAIASALSTGAKKG